MKRILFPILTLVISASLFTSCSEDGPRGDDTPESDRGAALDDGTAPAFNPAIVQWDGATATDGDLDVTGTDNDFYHELTTFNKSVTVEFSGASASVTSSTSLIKTHTDGAYVTIDMLTASVSGVEIIVKGHTADGGLKIYGGNKFLLTLDGADITSRRGPAINNQCKKRVFVHLTPGSKNLLTDCTEYTSDPYYRADSSADAEDRKGCFFSEGNMIFSGTGTLEVRGLARHAIATDGYMVVRPGVTIAVTEAARNCLQIKGSATDSIGLWMMGGYIYALATADAAKAVKTDQCIRIDGGRMELNTTGHATFDPDEGDTSSAACLKADTYVEINRGDLALRSSGNGAKGINAGSYISFTGGTATVACTGVKYIYSDGMTAPAKAIKATEEITISGGNLTAISTGRSDGSRGIESDASIDIRRGNVTVYSYDDALNAPAVTISGSTTTVNAFSIAEDAVKGKQSITVSGGSLTATAGSYPARAISCNDPAGVTLTGGSIVAVGGAASALPAAESTTLGYRTWNGLTASKSMRLTVKEGSNELYNFTLSRSFEGGSVLVAGSFIPAAGTLGLYSGSQPCANPQ